MKAFAKWIKPVRDFTDVCPVYTKKFSAVGEKATLLVTALGCYEAMLNGKRVSDYVLAPGWTEALLSRGGGGRLQFQSYDISHLLKEENTLEITVGKGWYRSPLAGWREEDAQGFPDPRLILPPALTAMIKTTTTTIETDETWQVSESPVRFSEIYDGEIYDARVTTSPQNPEPVEIYLTPSLTLIPQQGEEIHEMEKIQPLAKINTPKGESVIDFGQNITGYIEFTLPETTQAGTEIKISFAEVLDAEGNFYTENYRTAKSELHYICKAGMQTYKPKFTFYGFRYIKVEGATLQNTTAIAVYSDMERTGWLTCASPLLNRFFENVAWGQKGNFLDVPTDCPQRDERLGWTGDAQVFIKTAALYYNVEKFFTKWLVDVAIAQTENGLIPHVVPDTQQSRGGSAAWGDAATICPWELYLAYGDKTILQNQFDSMCRWVDFITTTTKDEHEWTGGTHFGDWLSLELPSPEVNPDIRRGATRHDFLASAFYAHSASLVVKAGKVLGCDVSSYKKLYKNVAEKFIKKYEGDYRTQTEYILALHFNLTNHPQKVADALAKKIAADGNCLKTGFVGTPYILHVLSSHGYTDLAYTLLLREEYPSWLYPVTKGATTIWERWDSIKPDGSFQTANMNSFNHYAYGAVADWVYTVAAGITMAAPG
ncbi:MAG: family 78 glycoside hydrolase catalytic domain, partial [Defluviitaleaceae bacterium]|nr:family 78 glycoside hydrolase catalytic domain [Defluviitaleaceae bacterium]